jgi:hypothetical protein
MVDEAPRAHAPPQAERQQPADAHITDGRHPGLRYFTIVSAEKLSGHVQVLIECAHRLTSLSATFAGAIFSPKVARQVNRRES